MIKKVAPLRYGVIFKKAFSDPEIFMAFVKDIVGVTVEIDKVETEKSFMPPIGRVKARFDLFAEDIKNRIVVDIQHDRFPDHYDRFLHYHCVALLEQIAKSDNYRPSLRVYTIVVLTSGDRHKNDVSLIDFDPKTLKGEALGEINHKVIYLCPKYVSPKTPEPYRTWLTAIDDTLDGEVDETGYDNDIIKKIFNHIEQDMVSPEERARMFDEHGQEALRQQAHQEGHQEGRAEEREEMVRAMLAKGIPVATIADVAGLSEAEILALKDGQR